MYFLHSLRKMISIFVIRIRRVTPKNRKFKISHCWPLIVKRTPWVSVDVYWENEGDFIALYVANLQVFVVLCCNLVNTLSMCVYNTFLLHLLSLNSNIKLQSFPFHSPILAFLFHISSNPIWLCPCSSHLIDASFYSFGVYSTNLFSWNHWTHFRELKRQKECFCWSKYIIL